MKCCVVYGSLPPETRAEQAEVFNDVNSGYNVLVASDAIGMGLNLNIKRIVFWKLTKYNSKTMVSIYFYFLHDSLQEYSNLSASLVKQIAGRAGRRGFHEKGEVTTFHQVEHTTLRKNLNAELPIILVCI